MPPPSSQRSLARLAASTVALRRAVEAGDSATVERLLERRQTEIEALRGAVEKRPLTERQIGQLGETIRQGEQSVNGLTAGQATARVQLAALKAERHRLAAWAPKQPEPETSLDLSA
jgi:hypothetical protein